MANLKALFNRAGKFQITIFNTRRTRRASAGAAGAPALRVIETAQTKKFGTVLSCFKIFGLSR